MIESDDESEGETDVPSRKMCNIVSEMDDMNITDTNIMFLLSLV